MSLSTSNIDILYFFTKARAIAAAGSDNFMSYFSAMKQS